MKRSKLFLGITTSLLAVAGIAAKHHSSQTQVFYTRNTCTPYKLLNVQNTGTDQIQVTDGTVPHTPYGVYLTNQCIVPAFAE